MNGAKIYRVTILARTGAIFFLTIAVMFVIGLILRLLAGEIEKQMMTYIVAPVFLLAGAYINVLAFGSKLTLDNTAVELCTPFSRKRLPLSAIRGRREYVVNGYDARTRYLKLETNDDRIPALNIAKLFNFDSSFYQWYRSLPDLDVLDKERKKDSNFGLV